MVHSWMPVVHYSASKKYKCPYSINLEPYYNYIMDIKGSERMKPKWIMAIAMIVFIAAGCSSVQEKKPVSKQPIVTDDSKPETTGGQQDKPSDETEKPA